MNDIYLIGDVGYEITLEAVVEAVKNSDQSEPLNVHIHSPGGSVYDGLAIYNYLKGLKQEVNTSSTGLVASIASIFFLAGNKDTRKVNSTDNFLIHLPSGGAFGNAEDLEKTADELRDIENKLADIYVNETSLTKDEALELMKKDEMLTTDFLLEKGFVSEIVEFKAVATFNNNKMSTETVTKKEIEGLFTKFKNEVKGFFNTSEPKNKVLQDANGIDINFVDLKKDDEVLVDANATIDNKKASGEYVMPNGNKFVFENGVLTNIIEEETDLEKLEAKNTELKDELQTSAETIVNKDAEIAAKDVIIDEMKTKFTAFKTEITSKFTEDLTIENKKEEITTGTRKLFKEN